MDRFFVMWCVFAITLAVLWIVLLQPATLAGTLVLSFIAWLVGAAAAYTLDEAL